MAAGLRRLGALALAAVVLAGCAPTPVTPTPFPFDSAIRARLAARQYPQAIYLLTHEAARGGWTAARLIQAGELWDRLGNPARAVAFWDAALRLDPGNPALAQRLAQTQLALGAWGEAAATLERLRALRPGDAWPPLQLGMLRAASDPGAAANLLRAAESEPGYRGITRRLLPTLERGARSPDSALQIGLALADLDQWAYAEAAFRHAADAHAPFPLAVAYAGLARDRQGKDGGPQIADAVALAPEDAQVRFLQGLHERDAGTYAASRDALELAVALDPENPAYQAELGTAYELLGDLPRADYWLASARRVADDDPRFAALLDAFRARHLQPQVTPDAAGP